MVRGLEYNPDAQIVPQTDTQFRATVERYSSGVTRDGASRTARVSLVMEERGITEALTYDGDFEQAGFVALLRRD